MTISKSHYRISMHNTIIVKEFACFFPLAPDQFTGDPDGYSIQPHLETQPSLSSQLSQPAPSNTPMPNPTPSGQGPPPSQSATGSNPYRIGVGIGTKKPAYGVTGIASFGSNNQQPAQPMVAPSQPLPPPSTQSLAQVHSLLLCSINLVKQTMMICTCSLR